MQDECAVLYIASVHGDIGVVRALLAAKANKEAKNGAVCMMRVTSCMNASNLSLL